MSRFDELPEERRRLARKVESAYFDAMEKFCEILDREVSRKGGPTYDDMLQAIKDWDPSAADLIDNWQDWMEESE